MSYLLGLASEVEEHQFFCALLIRTVTTKLFPCKGRAHKLHPRKRGASWAGELGMAIFGGKCNLLHLLRLNNTPVTSLGKSLGTLIPSGEVDF